MIGRLAAVVLLVALPLMACTDDVAAKCPPLAHPPVLAAAATGNPCGARKGEAAALLALRVVRTYQRTNPPAAGAPTRYPLRSRDAGYGYLHLLDALSKGRGDHGHPSTTPRSTRRWRTPSITAFP